MESGTVKLLDKSSGVDIELTCDFTERQKDILKCGGLLPYVASSTK